MLGMADLVSSNDERYQPARLEVVDSNAKEDGGENVQILSRKEKLPTADHTFFESGTGGEGETERTGDAPPPELFPPSPRSDLSVAYSAVPMPPSVTNESPASNVNRSYVKAAEDILKRPPLDPQFSEDEEEEDSPLLGEVSGAKCQKNNNNEFCAINFKG